MEASRVKEMEEVWDTLKKMRGSRNWQNLVDALEQAFETLEYRCAQIHLPLTVKHPIPTPHARSSANRPTSKGLRSGTHKQTNLGYAELVAEKVVCARPPSHATRRARASPGPSR